MKIECLLKRDGGTIVDMPRNDRPGNMRYHFKPEVPDDDQAAHVCEVTDKAHLGRFLAITDAYQVYDPEGEAPTAISIPKPESYIPENPYLHLSEVNPDTVDGDWLGGFAREVLQIQPRDIPLIRDKAKTSYDLTFDEKASANDMLRAILTRMIAEQKTAVQLNPSVPADSITQSEPEEQKPADPPKSAGRGKGRGRKAADTADQPEDDPDGQPEGAAADQTGNEADQPPQDQA